jgi:hypothetical protein
MLIIALQMIIRTRLPWRRKSILCFIFGLGIFVILAAALNKYYSFTQPFGISWTFWYVRESSTSIIVANLPFTWHLLRRMFKLSAFDPNATNQTQPAFHSSRTARGRKNYAAIKSALANGSAGAKYSPNGTRITTVTGTTRESRGTDKSGTTQERSHRVSAESTIGRPNSTIGRHGGRSAVDRKSQRHNSQPERPDSSVSVIDRLTGKRESVQTTPGSLTSTSSGDSRTYRSIKNKSWRGGSLDLHPSEGGLSDVVEMEPIQAPKPAQIPPGKKDLIR